MTRLYPLNRYPVWQHTFVSPSAFSKRAIVSYWRKYMHEVLVNRLGGLSLPRKSVVRITDRPDMTSDVYRGRKTTIQQKIIHRITATSYDKYSFVFILPIFLYYPGNAEIKINPFKTLKGKKRWNEGEKMISSAKHKETIPHDHRHHKLYKTYKHKYLQCRLR